MKLNSEHIRFVLDCMQENTTKIRNIKQYKMCIRDRPPFTQQGTFPKGKGLVVANALTSRRLGLHPCRAVPYLSLIHICSLLNLVTEGQRPLRVCMNNGKEFLLCPQDLLAPICDADVYKRQQ